MTDKVIQFPDDDTLEEEASRWIIQFESSIKPSNDDIEALQTWMARSPRHREVLLRLAKSWNNMDLLSELALPHMNAKTSSSVRLANAVAWLCAPFIFLLVIINGSVRLLRQPRGQLATAFTLVTAIGMVFWFTTHPQTVPYQTVVGEQVTDTLPDGSVLHLNTNTRVEVDYSGPNRQITLHQGEAHFDVAPDPNRPFEVYAGNQLVTAIGTAFSVYLDKERFEVIVSEGKVGLAVIAPGLSTNTDGVADRNGQPSLKEQADVNGYNEIRESLGSLVAGQSVVLPIGQNAIDKIKDYDVQEVKRQLSWLEGKLVFAGDPLGDVVREVSRYTSMQIEVETPELKNMRIGGQFQVGETEALFDVLESGFGLTITRVSEKHVRIDASQ